MHCSACGKEFKSFDTVFEYTSGFFDGFTESVVADTTYERWCAECDKKRTEAK